MRVSAFWPKQVTSKCTGLSRGGETGERVLALADGLPRGVVGCAWCAGQRCSRSRSNGTSSDGDGDGERVLGLTYAWCCCMTPKMRKAIHTGILIHKESQLVSASSAHTHTQLHLTFPLCPLGRKFPTLHLSAVKKQIISFIGTILDAF